MSRHVQKIPLVLVTSLIVLLISSGTAEAQTVGLTSSRHAAYLEVGGSTSIYSLNYEYQPFSNLAVRFGALTTPVSYRDASIHGGLVGAAYLIGEGRHKLELGGALTGGYVDGHSRRELFSEHQAESGFGLSVSPSLGYRFQPFESGPMLRAAFTPVFPVSGLEFSQSPLKGGLSVGWTF